MNYIVYNIESYYLDQRESYGCVQERNIERPIAIILHKQ